MGRSMPTGIMRTNKAGTIERDYRETGGFVPVGIKEKADDVPAMLSKNEFVMTADAVRGMGGGNIEKGAQRLYDQMKTMRKESSIMAVTETRVLPPEFIEAAGKTYLGDLQQLAGGYKTADLSKAFGQQFVAGQDPLQAQAQQLATQGIGAYKPFLQSASALASPTSYQQFMSPYQQDVINETLREFDVQAQKGFQD